MNDREPKYSRLLLHEDLHHSTSVTHNNVVKSKTFEEMRSVVPRMPQPYDEKNVNNPFGLYSLGRSIGVEQLDYPGTLGGFITVTRGDNSRVYGLTNNHVVNIGKATNTQRKF